MNLYSRARKHIDMDRVKELLEERIKREQIAEILQQQDKIRAELKEIEREESKYCDWKKELDEGMTTAGLGMINLDAVGDVDLVDLGNETPDPNVNPDATNVGGTYTFGPVNQEIETASSISFTQIDLSQVDTLVFNFTAGDIDRLQFDVLHPDRATSVYSLSTSSGAKVVTLRQVDRIKGARLVWLVSKGAGDPVGTNRMSGVALQRRRPMNLLVSLDDPEANSFIRGGLGGSEERKAKLKDMLEAGNELMIKLGLEPSKTTPGDIEIAGVVPTPSGSGRVPYDTPGADPAPGGSRGYKDPSTGKFVDFDNPATWPRIPKA